MSFEAALQSMEQAPSNAGAKNDVLDSNKSRPDRFHGLEATARESEKEPELSEIDKLKAELRKKEESLTSKFSGLTQRERQLMQKEQELKAKLGQVGSIEELNELAEKDPLKLLGKFGLDYDKLTDIYANMVPEDETKRSVGQLKSEIEELKKKLEVEAEQGQMKEIMRVKNEKLNALRGLATKEDSDYNLIAQFGVYEDVIQHMSQHYADTGEILSDEEAMTHVESKLVENFKKLADNPKVKRLLGLEQESSQGQEQVRPFGLSDPKLRADSPATENTRGLSEQQLFEMALQKLPDLK